MTRLARIVRLATGVAVALIAACDSGQVSNIPLTGTAADSADQILYGAHSTLAYNGVRRGDAAGDTVLTFGSATRFEFIGLRAQFTSPLARPLATMTARRGAYSLERAVLETEGPVTIVSDTTRRRIEGSAVRYDVAKNQLVSDRAFVATAGTRKLTGVGFTADPGLFSIKCAKNCSGSLP